MAFEPILKFALNIRKETLAQREKYNELLMKDRSPQEQNRLYRAAFSDDIYCLIMTDYYECINDIRKFRGQSGQIKDMMFELWPAYSKGYFNVK